MKTEIGSIGLGLPAGLERRGARIGRLVGESLARSNLPAGTIERLSLGPVAVDTRRTDRAIADSIAGSMIKAIRAETARRPAVDPSPSPSSRPRRT